VDHLRRGRPRTCLLENVDELLKPSCAADLRFLWKTLESVGYAGASKVMASAKFGVPQNRIRVFFLLFGCAAMGYTMAEARQRAVEVLEFTDCLQIPPFELKDFLLKDSSSKVAAELVRRQSAKAEDSTSFNQTHTTFLKSKGLSWQHVVAQEPLASNPWYELVPRREKECLVFGLQSGEAKAVDTKTSLTSIDIGPRIDRLVYSYGGMLPTLTPGSKLWIPSLPTASMIFEACQAHVCQACSILFGHVYVHAEAPSHPSWMQSYNGDLRIMEAHPPPPLGAKVFVGVV